MRTTPRLEFVVKPLCRIPKYALNSNSYLLKFQNKLLYSTSSSTSILSKYLTETIKTTGPLSLAAYMRQCLTNPEAGYYINKDPFGKQGDFITSPEISQMFGELVGIWFLSQSMLNHSKRIRLVELGPGRGTLMDDILRTSQSFGAFHKSIEQVCLVEASPTLRIEQAKLLGDDNYNMAEPDAQESFQVMSKYNIPVRWMENIKEIQNDPDVSTYVIAHEFFDALPIHQFEKTDKGWRELLVDCNQEEGEENKNNTPSSLGVKKIDNNQLEKGFHLTLNPSATPSSQVIPKTHERYDKLMTNSRVEICPEAWEISAEIGRLINENEGSAALIIDYGPADTIPINTLRGIRNHKIVSPFEKPGTADLSADVDFQALAIASKIKYPNIDVHGPVTQGDWLHTMGIGARATVLATNAKTAEARKRVADSYKRLVDQGINGMGKLYKVMALTSSSTSKPVGFGGDL